MPTQWRTDIYREIVRTQRSLQEVAAASQAIHTYLPQEQNSRLTFGMSRAGRETGVGVGYAFRVDDETNTAFTLGVGRSGNETVVQASMGFEFGGKPPAPLPVSEVVREELANQPDYVTREEMDAEIARYQKLVETLAAQNGGLLARLAEVESEHADESAPVQVTQRIVQREEFLNADKRRKLEALK